MNDEMSAPKSSETNENSELEPVRPLGSSPAGESFEVVRSVGDDDTLEEDSDLISERLVLKKLTRSRLRSPERFRQKFDALCRLEHPNLCPYRQSFVGETATRILRDFVDGMALDDYLLQPITEEESQELTKITDETDQTEESDHTEERAHTEETDKDDTTQESVEPTPDSQDVASKSDTAGQGDHNGDQTTDSASGSAPEDQQTEQAPGSSDAKPTALSTTVDDTGHTAQKVSEAKTDSSDTNHGDDSDESSDAVSQENASSDRRQSETLDESLPPESADSSPPSDDRPSTLEIPNSLLEDSEAADRTLDLLILRLRRIIPSLIDALEYLHRFRHVHGNLTPSNLLVTDDDRVILTDFGLHPELVIPAESRDRHRSYHAPEVERGEYSSKSDLYSLGAILFEILAGRPYGTRRRTDTPNGSGEQKFGPVYLSEIVPHCPATWVDLIHALLAPDPDDRPPLDEVHRQLAASEARSVNIPASVVETPDTLHGRGESLERLIDDTTRCSQRRILSIAVVEGETGVGKTALIDAVARRTAQRGWVVLHGRSFHNEAVAYQGFEEIVDLLVAIIDGLPEKARRRLSGPRRRASRLFPQLSTETGARPDIDRRAAVEGFRQLLAGLSEQRPILICFDDIHWAGHDSARLLADLAARPQGMRLMVIASWRPDAEVSDDSHPFWTELETAPIMVNRIGIEGFSKDEAREYVRQHAAHLPLRQKERILHQGGLNPLLIDELIHEFQTDAPQDAAPPSDTTSKGVEANHDQNNNDQTDTNGDVDHYLRTFVEQRIAELSRAERLVLQLLAIASGPLAPELMARAMTREIGTQTSDLVSGQEVAEALVEQRLARRARRIAPASDEGPRYVVVHDLCRRTVLAELGRDHHTRLCGLIADALASGDEDSDDLRFEYLLRAGRGEEATRAAVLAARTAIDRYAYHRASKLWSWIADRDELQERDRIDYANALLGAGRFQEAIVQLDDLVPADEPGLDRARRCARVRAHLSAGDRRAAIEAMDDAVVASSSSYREQTIWSRATDLRRRFLATIGRWSDATTVATDDAPSDETQATAQVLDFALNASPFLLSDRRRSLEYQYADLAVRDGSASLLARDRLWMVGAPWLPFMARDGNKLDRWTEQALSLSDRIDDDSARARTQELKALVARHRGHIDGAIDHIGQANALVESGRISEPLLELRLALLRVDLHLWRGEPDEAAQIVERLLHQMRHRRWLWTLAQLGACDHALLTGDLDAASEAIDHIDEFVGEHQNCLLHLWMMDRRTRLLIARDRAEVAVANWDLLLDRDYPRSLRRLPEARQLISLNLARALASLAKRQIALDEPHQSETIRRLRRNVRRLGDSEDWMGPIGQTRLLHLRSRLASLRQRHNRALRYAQQAADNCGDDAPLLLQAITAEALGLTMNNLEQPDGRTQLDDARSTYDDMGLFLPLALEGWPIPSSHARLGQDSD